ncbi:MAG: hypothetical protein Q8K55_15670 [Gemmatimonadaceae bacterium]|nr:hypothetical protein [Gemmatimonadaceae bacterium]
MAAVSTRPICIITINGLQCFGSPLVSHYPDASCRITDRLPKADADIDALAQFLTQPRTGGQSDPYTLDAAKADVIARVAYLMANASCFDPTLPFTVIRS